MTKKLRTQNIQHLIDCYNLELMSGTKLFKILAGWVDKASGYLLAVASTLTAAAVRYSFQGELEEKSRLMLFIPAVLVSAWYGGIGPGVFALFLGVFLVAWLLIPPVNTIDFGGRSDQVSMLLYLVIGTMIIVLAHRERTEKQIRECAQAELLNANFLLEQRVRERTSELEVANQELEGFCYSVSHDLRTPTRAIVGNAHILLEDYGSELSPTAKEKLGRISNAALKLSDLVDALLTYARLAKSGLSKEVINISQLLSVEVASLSEASGKRVHLERPPEMFVFADKSQLSVAMSALVSNSLKYSKPGEPVKICVSCEQAGDEIVVKFEDDGIGFDSAYMHKVFEPFERLHRDEEYPGVGMGLANVARILERHDGSVWAEASVGKGTTIYLQFGKQPDLKAQQKHLKSA